MFRSFIAIAISVFASCASANSQCPIDEVVVKGRIDYPPANAQVRLQLIYAKNMPGESGDITPETDRFTLPVDFLTQSRKPEIAIAMKLLDMARS